MQSINVILVQEKPKANNVPISFFLEFIINEIRFTKMIKLNAINIICIYCIPFIVFKLLGTGKGKVLNNK